VSILGTPNIDLHPLVTCDPGKNLDKSKHQYVNASCFAIPKTIGQNGPTTLPVVYGPAFFNTDLGLFKNFAIKERYKLQFRANGFNFLNHPLWSFGSATNLTLGYSGSTGDLTSKTFGYATEKQGKRVIQLAVKFIF
jgi:hypothetical protein